MNVPQSEYDRGTSAEIALARYLKSAGDVVLGSATGFFPGYDVVSIEGPKLDAVNFGTEAEDIAKNARTWEIKHDNNSTSLNIPIEVAQYENGRWEVSGLTKTDANFFAVYATRDNAPPRLFLARSDALLFAIKRAQGKKTPYRQILGQGANPQTWLILIPIAEFEKLAQEKPEYFWIAEGSYLTGPLSIHPLTPIERAYLTLPVYIDPKYIPEIEVLPRERIIKFVEARRHRREAILRRISESKGVLEAAS